MKKNEMSYILVTPYSIVKSRTGAMIARILSRIDLELVGIKILTPDEEFVTKYAQTLLKYNRGEVDSFSNLLHQYVLKQLMPTEGRPHRMMVLLFKGENAVEKTSAIVGGFSPENQSMEMLRGETIRDTYADIIYADNASGEVVYFEPAVISPRSDSEAVDQLTLFSAFAETAPNIVSNMKYSEPEKVERTLVILKPDNWRYASSKPGTIIDMFSRTGLRMVGVKLYRMSVSEALSFYGPVEAVLKEKLSPIFGNKAADMIETEFGIILSAQERDAVINSAGVSCARDQFYKIIEFMAGTRPDKCPPEELENAGKVKSLVIVYEGINAVDKIRRVLGPTDPSKAPGGTVRREFGHDVMVNTAHASDSPENAAREMKVVKIEKNDFSSVISKELGF